jgi:hypothetical protein
MTEKVNIVNATHSSDFDLGDEDRTPRKSWKTPRVILPTDAANTMKTITPIATEEYHSAGTTSDGPS